MHQNQIKIIQPIHGKRTSDGKISEPDIYWILDRWLERHPEVQHRHQDIRIVRGQWTTNDGLKTEVIRASIIAGDDIADYDPAVDADLYQYFLAEER
jgi:hypothetical protein